MREIFVIAGIFAVALAAPTGSKKKEKMIDKLKRYKGLNYLHNYHYHPHHMLCWSFVAFSIVSSLDH